MRRILLAYDGSDPARRALDRAVAEARDSHGRITVLSVEELVLDPNVPRNFGTLDDIADWEGESSEAPADVVAHLTEARQLLGDAGVDADFTWAAGEPGQTIAETARRINADAIVLGEHHHGRLASFFGADVDAMFSTRSRLRRHPRRSRGSRAGRVTGRWPCRDNGRRCRSGWLLAAPGPIELDRHRGDVVAVVGLTEAPAGVDAVDEHVAPGGE